MKKPMKPLKKSRVIETQTVVDRTYGGRLCYPISYTTLYHVADKDGKYLGVLTSDDCFLID